jgi:hypothetical protein
MSRFTPRSRGSAAGWPARSPRPRRARADEALAHGDVVAEAAARPGMSAERVAERIARCPAAGSTITVHAAGEVVPAFEVLDAVGGGVAEMGHTAAFYWQGKQPAAASSPPCRSG